MNSRLRLVGAISGAWALIASVAVLTATTDHGNGAAGLIRQVRAATSEFRDLDAALAAGYGSTGSCVSGPQEGAMGVHYANPTLIGDHVLDASQPELLIYEQRGGRLRFVGVEFLVLAAEWDAANAAPPVLEGQHFHYVGSPNRYRLPAFYELHVWAWRENPHGAFADWNPAVSCDEYTGGNDDAHAHD
jgi:hypothetical protein